MPTTDIGFADLTEEQFKEVMRLYRVYYREAKRCRDAKAYLAGCTMLGAALEAQLLGMVHCFSEEVARAFSIPKRDGKPKVLLKWNLGDLLRVSKELSWLPAGLSLDEQWSSRRARIGDYAEALRQLRNLVHTGRYVSDHSPSRVTAKYLERSFEVLDIAVKYLYRKLEDSIRKDLQNETDT